MKTIKVIYDNNTDFIVDITEEFASLCYVDFYNLTTYKQKSKIRKMQENFGTKKLPLLIFQDENLNDYNAIWTESNPNWSEEIVLKLMKDG